MAAKVRERRNAHWVFCNHEGQRRAKLVGPGKDGKKLADALAKQWNAWLTLGQAERVFEKKAKATPAGAMPRLRDAVVAWIDRREAGGDFRAATSAAYGTALRTWVFPHVLPDGRLLGDVAIHEVTREQIGGVIAAIKAAKRSRSVIGHVRNALRGFYTECVEMKQITVNPALDLRFFIGRMKRAPKRGIFSAEECRQMLRAAEGEGWWSAFLSMALGTGLRWGELAGLTRDDVDLKGRRVHVRQSWSPKANAVQDPKTGKGRVVPMSAELVAVMRAHMETRTAEGWGPQSLVFPGENGRHMRHFHERWAAFLKRAGVAHRPFHCTRHSFASHALKAGVRPENVQRWLGHATLSMTIDTYREYIADHESDARDVERLGEILC